jgi:hypothetical protein
LRQRGYDAEIERDLAVRGGERCLALGTSFTGGLQPANSGYRNHVYGLARHGCGSIRELSPDAQGLDSESVIRLLLLQNTVQASLTAMRARIRLWTAIALIAICGFSVVRGCGIVQFSLALANMDSSAKRAEMTNRWAAAPDVASAALQAELREKINISDPKEANRRREVISSILSIKPLSAANWLSLSGAQFVTDQPIEQVLGSLELSMMSGPNEGYLMWDRGIFGLSIWEHLSPNLKSRVAVDLAAGNRSEIGKIRAVLSTKPVWVRNELREALLGAGLAPKDIEQRLGF